MPGVVSVASTRRKQNGETRFGSDDGWRIQESWPAGDARKGEWFNSAMDGIAMVAFDGDGTLWRSQDFYDAAQAQFERGGAGAASGAVSATGSGASSGPVWAAAPHPERARGCGERDGRKQQSDRERASYGFMFYNGGKMTFRAIRPRQRLRIAASRLFPEASRIPLTKLVFRRNAHARGAFAGGY